MKDGVSRSGFFGSGFRGKLLLLLLLYLTYSLDWHTGTLREVLSGPTMKGIGGLVYFWVVSVDRCRNHARVTAKLNRGGRFLKRKSKKFPGWDPLFTGGDGIVACPHYPARRGGDGGPAWSLHAFQSLEAPLPVEPKTPRATMDNKLGARTAETATLRM